MNNKKELQKQLQAKEQQLAIEWKKQPKDQARIDRLTDEVRSLEEKLSLKKSRV